MGIHLPFPFQSMILTIFRSFIAPTLFICGSYKWYGVIEHIFVPYTRAIGGPTNRTQDRRFWIKKWKMSGKTTIFPHSYLPRVLRGECEIFVGDRPQRVLSIHTKKSGLVLNLGPPFLGKKVENEWRNHHLPLRISPTIFARGMRYLGGVQNKMGSSHLNKKIGHSPIFRTTLRRPRFRYFG